MSRENESVEAIVKTKLPWVHIVTGECRRGIQAIHKVSIRRSTGTSTYILIATATTISLECSCCCHSVVVVLSLFLVDDSFGMFEFPSVREHIEQFFL